VNHSAPNLADVRSWRRSSFCCRRHFPGCKPNVDHGAGKARPDLCFIPVVRNNLAEISFESPVWVRLNRLGTGVGWFNINKHTWGLWLHQRPANVAPSSKPQIILSWEQYGDTPKYQLPHGADGLAVLGGETKKWFLMHPLVTWTEWRGVDRLKR